MNKKIIKLILFPLGFFVLMNLIGCLFLPFSSVKDYGIFKTVYYDITLEEKDTIDTIFLGDSIFYNSVSPLKLYHEYGFTSYDCAIRSQTTKQAYKYLEVAIEHEHPKVVFFSANSLFRDPAKQPTYWKVKNQIQYYLPIFKIHSTWKNIFSSNPYGDIAKGYKYTKMQHKANPKNHMKPTKQKKEIADININYLKKMKELCDENNIEFIVVSVPSLVSWNSARANGAIELLKDLDIKFIDLNIDQAVIIDWNKESKDQGDHLNYKGASKITKWFGEYLKETDLVEDHRGEKKYASWEEAYQKFLIEFPEQ